MNTQKPIVVIVINLQGLLSIVKNKIEKFWPNHSVYFIINHPMNGLYKFDYPRESNNLLFPYITEPTWKYHAEDTGYVWHIENKEVIKTDYSTSAIIKSAETIALMGSLGVSETLSFQILLDLSLGKIKKKSYILYYFEYITDETITASLNNPITTDCELFEKSLNGDIAKRFFEYNFNFNSCVLFKPVLQKAGILSSDFVFTKYLLQFFLALRHCVNFSEDDMLELMLNWKGTGLYTQFSLGIFSNTLMIENLNKAGLIEENGNGTKENVHYDLSEKGKIVLKLIHPDCTDIDILGKVDVWMRNWPESKKEMDEYLITFFKKQMEFVPSK